MIEIHIKLPVEDKGKVGTWVMVKAEDFSPQEVLEAFRALGRVASTLETSLLEEEDEEKE